MEIKPIPGIEGASVVFRGFPPARWTGYKINPVEKYFKPSGILLLENPVPPEGVGEKLDVIA